MAKKDQKIRPVEFILLVLVLACAALVLAELFANVRLELFGGLPALV